MVSFSSIDRLSSTIVVLNQLGGIQQLRGPNFAILWPLPPSSVCTVFIRVQNKHFLIPDPKLYVPSTLNIELILWHTQLIVCAENVKSWFKSWFFPFTFQAYILPPIHWIVCVLAYQNFWISFSAAQNGRLCPDT